MDRSPETIFHNARLIPNPADRAAYLDDACEGDAELRAEIDALLEADDKAADFLKTEKHANPHANPHATASRLPWEDELSEGPGTRIGPYKILQRIGEGGFGAVFLAEQSEPVRRRVALKIIKPGMDSRQVIARFEAERQALAMMNHPHIARVLDGGLTESGRPYFVMEYVVGDAITRFADAHKLSVDERLELFRQVCQAVQQAHTKGVIHRDLKPANVLVSMVDGKPFARVIDFGIAKATGAAGERLTDKTLFTMHGQLIGTPEYMSPEQAGGDPDIDTRTDVYALGVLLYELLTGSTPFRLTELKRFVLDDIRKMIREDDPPSPSLRLSRDLETLAATAAARRVEPGRLGALVKGELDWIVMKALEKDRARRYETATALAADVGRHLSGEAVVAAPPSRVYRVRKFVRKHRGPVVAGSAVGAALLIGFAGTAISLYFVQYNANAARNNAQVAERALGHLEVANESLIAKTDEAEWSAYTANLALAQAAMEAGNYPEARDRIAACPEEKRGWEWEFFCSESQAIEWQVDGRITGALFSPDGEHVLAFDQASLRILSAATGQIERESAPLEPNIALSADYSPDGQFVAIGGFDTKVYIFDTSLDEPILELGGTSERHRCIAYSADGSKIVAGRQDGTAQLWTTSATASVAELNELKDHGWLNAVAFSPDGKYIASASDDGMVGIWSASGSLLQHVNAHAEEAGDVEFAPDSSYLASASWDGTVKLWPVPSLTDPLVLRHYGNGGSASFSPDGKSIATTSEGSSVINLWDCEAGTLLAQWKRSFNWGYLVSGRSVEFSPDGNGLLVLQDDHNVIVDPMTWGQRLTLFDSSAYGGPQLAIGADERVNLHSASILNHPLGDPTLTLTTPDATRRIVGGADRTVRFFDVASEREVASIRVDDAVTDLKMTADGTRLVIMLADGSARVWDIRDPSERRKDYERAWAERVPAGAYLDELMAGPTATGELMSAIEADALLTPLRRLVAAEMLQERLADMEHKARTAMEALTEGQTDPAAVQAAAGALDLPPRVKAMVVERAGEWEYVPPRVDPDERLADETRQRRLAEADLVMERRLGEQTDFRPPTLDDLAAAAEARERYYGPDSDATLIAQFEFAKELLFEGAIDRGLGIFDAVLQRKERTTQTPDAMLISMWAEAGCFYTVYLQLDKAERVNALLINWLMPAFHAGNVEHIADLSDDGHVGRWVGIDEERVAKQIGKLARRGQGEFREFALRIALAVSIRHYRDRKYSEAIAMIDRIEEKRGEDGDSAHPIDLTILAMAHHQLALQTNGAKADTHRTAARDALAKARALMAPSPDGTPSPWADDADARALLAEAEALIEGVEPK